MEQTKAAGLNTRPGQMAQNVSLERQVIHHQFFCLGLEIDKILTGDSVAIALDI